MRYVLVLLALFVPAVVQAFDFSELQKMADDPDAMQRAAEEMAKGVAKATECAKGANLEKMQAEGQAMHQKIKALCEKGDRKGAENVAMEYSRKFINSPEYEQLKKCGEQMMAYMPQGYMQDMQARADDAGKTDTEPTHICDAIQ